MKYVYNTNRLNNISEKALLKKRGPNIISTLFDYRMNFKVLRRLSLVWLQENYNQILPPLRRIFSRLGEGSQKLSSSQGWLPSNERIQNKKEMHMSSLDSEMFANTPTVMALMSIRQVLLLLGDVSASQVIGLNIYSFHLPFDVPVLSQQLKRHTCSLVSTMTRLH